MFTPLREPQRGPVVDTGLERLVTVTGHTCWVRASSPGLYRISRLVQAAAGDVVVVSGQVAYELCSPCAGNLERPWPRNGEGFLSS